MDPAALALVFDEASHLLTVTGELDELTAAELRDAIRKHSGDYSHPVVVDLSGVEYLPSAAIGVLAKSMQEAEARGHAVELVALDGTVAQRVLQVCALPHRTS